MVPPNAGYTRIDRPVRLEDMLTGELAWTPCLGNNFIYLKPFSEFIVERLGETNVFTLVLRNSYLYRLTDM